jgi:uncharacterized membrane protein YcaP (DUF421 family)
MLTDLWQNMFILALPILEKIIRPIIIYLFLVVGLRLAGKRELASLNPLDLVVLLTLSNTVQNAIIGNDNSITGGIIGAATLLIMNFIVVRFLYKHPKVDHMLEGEPEVLVENGKVKWDVLHKQMITSHELEIAANKQGFINLAHIAKAEIEPGGSIFFAEKEPTVNEMQYTELIRRLDRIEKAMASEQNRPV